jgi:hypothetical protein
MNNNRFIKGFLTMSLLASTSVWADENYFPTDAKVAHPEHRELITHPGLEIKNMEEACVVNMMNLSPSTEASNIHGEVLRTIDGVILEMTANFHNVKMVEGDTKNLDAAFRCEYRSGSLITAIWTRNLGGLWREYDSPQITQADLGQPFPAGVPNPDPQPAVHY